MPPFLLKRCSPNRIMRAAFLGQLYVFVATAPKHWGQPRFAGKVVLVTGGDSGIGLAAVETFYYECANVMMVGHSMAKTKAAAENLTMLTPAPACPEKPSLSFLAVDVSNGTAVTEMMAQTVRVFGRVDIAVNRARFMTGGGYRLLVSANFGELVLGCINAEVRN